MAIGNRRRSKNNKTVFNLVKKAATVGVVSTLQNSTIDWSIANVYTKQITSNEILEFVNDTDGKTIHLVLENTSESPVTVSFPGGLHKSSSLQDILQAGTQSIYTLVKAGNDIYITQDVFTDLTSFADTDGDGVTDNLDAFPNDAAESVDSDGDGVGDNADAFPSDPTETLDTDGDGVGDNSDNAPLIANPDQADLDQDGIADVLDEDIDGDGVANELDAFPNDATRSEDPDTDGDGINDEFDINPNNISESTELFLNRDFFQRPFKYPDGNGSSNVYWENAVAQNVYTFAFGVPISYNNVFEPGLAINPDVSFNIGDIFMIRLEIDNSDSADFGVEFGVISGIKSVIHNGNGGYIGPDTSYNGQQLINLDGSIEIPFRIDDLNPVIGLGISFYSSTGTLTTINSIKIYKI